MLPTQLIVSILILVLSVSLGRGEDRHGQLLSSHGDSYTRVIELSDKTLFASFHDTEKKGLVFFRSVDRGASFQYVSSYTDNEDEGSVVGPQSMIELPNGDILLAFNIFPLKFDSGQKLRVARSRDRGVTWSIVSSPEPDYSVWNWEPELIRSSDGKLQLYYAWSPKVKWLGLAIFDQKIVRRESSDDGMTWSNRIVAIEQDNHGMPVITRMGETYFLAIERYQAGGQVFVLESKDGKDWTGGWPMKTSSGWAFSTPAITNHNGRLYGMGMYYKQLDPKKKDLAHSKNGKVILMSDDQGRSWVEVASPFEFKQTVSKSPVILDDKYKTNWSPGLLGIAERGVLLMTTSEVTTPRSERFGVLEIQRPND